MVWVLSWSTAGTREAVRVDPTEIVRVTLDRYPRSRSWYIEVEDPDGLTDIVAAELTSWEQGHRMLSDIYEGFRHSPGGTTWVMVDRGREYPCWLVRVNPGLHRSVAAYRSDRGRKWEVVLRRANREDDLVVAEGLDREEALRLHDRLAVALAEADGAPLIEPREAREED